MSVLFHLRHDQQKTQLLLENGDLKKRVKQLISESEDIAANRLMLIGNNHHALYMHAVLLSFYFFRIIYQSVFEIIIVLFPFRHLHFRKFHFRSILVEVQGVLEPGAHSWQRA